MRKHGEESPGSAERRCRVTPGGGDPRESATESRRRRLRPRHGERVRQERTARLVTGAARQTPPGARPNRGGIWASFQLVTRVGCLSPHASAGLEEWSPISCEGRDRTRLTDPLALFFILQQFGGIIRKTGGIMRFYSTLTAVAAVISVASPGWAQPTTVQQDFDAATQLYQAKNYQGAVAAWETLEKRAARNPRTLAIARVRKSFALLALDRKGEAADAARAGLDKMPDKRRFAAWRSATTPGSRSPVSLNRRWIMQALPKHIARPKRLRRPTPNASRPFVG